MKRRIAAIILAVLMAAAMIFPAQAGWYREPDSGRWMYASNTTKKFQKNVLRPSGGLWWWIGKDYYLWTGHEGGTVKLNISGTKYILTLNENGSVKPECTDEMGAAYNLYDLLGPGYGTNSKWVRRNQWMKVRKSDESFLGWRYNDGEGKPLGYGVHEIDGLLFYIDNEGEIKSQDWGLRDGYYLERADYSLAVDKWVPYRGNWYYFGADAKQVFGKNTINGVEYDFGSKGYVSGNKVDFPIVTKVELGEYPSTAHVGDTVEIPFKITVKQRVASSSNAEIATPSDADKAEYEYVEPDYDMFKTVYAVGDKNRYNMAVGAYLDKVDTAGIDQYGMDTRYEIDWDNQVLRLKIHDIGTAFGTFTIDGDSVIRDEKGFVIQCYYPEDMPGDEQLGDLYEKINGNSVTTEQAVSTLKNMDKEKLKESLLNDNAIGGEKEDITVKGMLMSIEFLSNESRNVETYRTVDEGVSSQIEASKLQVVGLGLSADENTSIGLHVGAAEETLPKELSGKQTAAFDLKVMASGKPKKELDVPVLITMPKPRSIPGDSFELYHINDGIPEEIAYVYDADTNATMFAADSFSTYVFAAETASEGGNSGSDSDSSDSDGSGSSSSGGSSGSTSRGAAKSEWSAGQWKMDENGWWYQGVDGTYPKSCWAYLEWNGQKSWYHFNERGYMDIGWLMDGGFWYYLNPIGDGNRGMMYTGWHEIDGKWYYFNTGDVLPVGAMLADMQTPDGYRVDRQGRWIP